MAKRKALKKISAWLAEHDSHGIYDAKLAAESIERETGYKATWRGAPASSIRAEIKARGLGGSYRAEVAGIAGFEMAEFIASRECGFTSDKMGRGRRFWESIDALKAAGK